MRKLQFYLKTSCLLSNFVSTGFGSADIRFGRFLVAVITLPDSRGQKLLYSTTLGSEAELWCVLKLKMDHSMTFSVNRKSKTIWAKMIWATCHHRAFWAQNLNIIFMLMMHELTKWMTLTSWRVTCRLSAWEWVISSFFSTFGRRLPLAPIIPSVVILQRGSSRLRSR